MLQTAASTADRLAACHSDRWRHMQRALRAVMQTGDEESVHRLRLDIKKLLALYDLAGHCHYRPHSRRDQRPLIHLFRRLGTIRDHSNAVALCMEFRIDPEILVMPAGGQDAQLHRLRIQAGRHAEDLRRLRRRTSRQIAQAEEGQWESYLREKVHEARHLLRAATGPAELHTARKCIKQLLYNASLPGAPEGEVSAGELARLDRIQEEIGRWHDVEVFGERLQALGYDSSHPSRYEAVLRRARRLRRELSREIKKAQP